MSVIDSETNALMSKGIFSSLGLSLGFFGGPKEKNSINSGHISEIPTLMTFKNNKYTTHPTPALGT